MARRLAVVFIELWVVLVLVCAGAFFWAAYYIDTDAFRARFTQSLSAAIGREVQLVGDIGLNLWPDIALVVSDLWVAEAPGFGDEPFVMLDTMSINVRVMPLLSKSVQIESISVDGLQGKLIYTKDNRFNFQSLIVHRANGEGNGADLDGWSFKLEDVEISNANIVFKDETGGNEYRMSGITMRTGGIAAGKAVPFTVGSVFAWDKGVSADLRLSGVVEYDAAWEKITLRETSVAATVQGAFLPEGEPPGELFADVELDWKNKKVTLRDFQARMLGLRAEGSIETGNLGKDLSVEGHVAVRPFFPAALITRLVPDFPVSKVDGLRSSAAATFFKADEKGVVFTDLVATLDDITARGRLGFTGYRDPVFDFSLRANTIDLDRYLPLFRTGTPFIWADYNLPLFRAFKGKGSVRADGLRILDTVFSDIRVAASADESIVFDAGAMRKGMVSVGGGMKVTIGQDDAKGVPSLAIAAKIDAESQSRGFAFLQNKRLAVDAPGVLSVDAQVLPMPCPPDERSMVILDHLSGKIGLVLGKGTARYAAESGKTTKLGFKQANVTLAVKPRGNGAPEFWKSAVTASLKLHGDADVRGVALDARGPVSVDIVKGHVLTRGLGVKGHAALRQLPKDARRITFSGAVDYDSQNGTVRIEDGLCNVLETALSGRADITGLNKEIRAEGAFAIHDADPKRITYLLADYSIRTEDAEALRKASLSARFSADKDGFVLSDLSAELDGLPITGHVAGTGYTHPMLAFSLSAGAFDLDRYLPPSRPLSLEEKRSGAFVKAPPVDLPMAFLRFLKLNGHVSFDEFKLARVRTGKLIGHLRANNGIIHISEVQGASYGGRLTADWKGEVGKTWLKTHLKLHVEDMEAGDLMVDMTRRDYVRGKADVDIDLTSKGTTDDDILANLRGKTSSRIVNGSFKFTGYPREGFEPARFRSEEEKRKAGRRGKARTVFDKAMSSFTVHKGVFVADKFRVEAPPVLQSYGKGSFSLPENTINMSIRNDFVAIPSVTFELTGRLTDPKVHVPTGRIVNDTVFNILSIPKRSFDFFFDLFE